MLCDRLVAHHVAFGVAEAKRFDEVRVLRGAVRTGDAVRIVTVEIETLLRMQKHFEAIIALQIKDQIQTRRFKIDKAIG